MARIKHIAILPRKWPFYKEVFGLQEVGQAGRGYYLSDGYINLAILKSSDQGTVSPRDIPGYADIDHLGFLVDFFPKPARSWKRPCQCHDRSGGLISCLSLRPTFVL